ncbi:hypothetical protein HYH03_005145 [Edaphochlamys debaryana]|uniref:Ankyrin repeat domain-containing protein n=1 Tax=Edaphochlamys debaryana TaxID=47281 RepID=A0A836C2L6_9CHLO|nr:hypothetical protein HYH03_005145 [Edaphochlamys debaryana]|eukprot:KAG2496734.1 hypothetical protein HYH03_005145 [Edaphochlamys debaryana]
MTRERRECVIGIAASCRDVADLGAFLAAAGMEPNQRLVEVVASRGSLEACRWLVDPCRFKGKLDQMSLRGPIGELEAPAAFSAAREGQETVLDAVMARPHGFWLSRHPGKIGVCKAAFKGCALATAQRMWERAVVPAWTLVQADRVQLLSSALVSKRDWQAKAEFLIERGVQLSPRSYSTVAELAPTGTVLERFEWLEDRGLDPCNDALPNAAARGDSAAVAWLLGEGAAEVEPSVPQRAFEAAARSGCVEALRLLAGEGLGFSLPGVIAAAAEGGQAGSLQWAWDDGAGAAGVNQPALFLSAAKSGSREAMRWLAAHGCPGTKGAWAKAVESGCEAAVELLAKLGCPKPTDGGPYAEALHLRDWRLLPVLKRAGVSFGPPKRSNLVLQALRMGARVAVLEWLLAHGCPPPKWSKALSEMPEGSTSKLWAWVRGKAAAEKPERRGVEAWADEEACWEGWEGRWEASRTGQDHQD